LIFVSKNSETNLNTHNSTTLTLVPQMWSEANSKMLFGVLSYEGQISAPLQPINEN